MSEDRPSQAPPRANPDLFGHDDAEASLRQAWDAGRLAHAWLITGPPGIGKATLAFRIARFALANGVPTAGGLFGSSLPASSGDQAGLGVAPSDPVFQRVASGGHLDLVVLERETNEKTGKLRSEIIVDQVRRMRDRLGQTAAEGGWRVVVIDPADDMNRNAQNALLKVLEEPPARTLLLLVCHRPGRLLPTVRSRCRRLPLRPLADPLVADLLSRFEPALGAVESDEVVRLAAGSIGRALTLAASGGARIQTEVDGVLTGLPDLDIVALHRLSDQVGKAGADEVFRLATDHLMDRLGAIVRASAGAPSIDGTSGDVQAVSRLAVRAGLDRWLELWDKVRALLARTESANLDRKQVFLTVVLDMREAVRTS